MKDEITHVCIDDFALKKRQNYGTVMIDIHTHIFPELDDGSNSVQNSIAMLREEALQGVKGVFLTPHYRRCYMPSAEQVKSRFDDFCKIAKQEGINLELFLGQEIYFLKDNFLFHQAKSIFFDKVVRILLCLRYDRLCSG